MQRNYEYKGGRASSPGTTSRRARWLDDLGLSPTECSPTASGSALISGVHTAQIHGGAFNMVGRDSINATINNYNYGHHVVSIDVLEILNSLPLPNFRDIQQDTIAKATEGTCLWFTTEEMFIFWIKEGKILWGIGIPGAGKTILASIVIRYLEQLEKTSDGAICVAYVYLRYSEPLAIRDILESFVKQIIERHPDVASTVESIYALHKRERTRPTEKDLVGVLCQCSANGKTLIFVLDALDELRAEDRPVLLRLLVSLEAKLFITSRPLEILQRQFTQAQVFDIAARASDIELHIQDFLRHSPELMALLEGSDFEERIIGVILRKSSGMFLHAKLQLEALRHCISIQDVEETLEEFPMDIEEIYMRTWERILAQAPKHANLAQLVFLWVLHARSEMDIEALRRAIATNPDTHDYESKRLVPQALLVSVCCGLVSIDEKTRIVRLVHYTMKDAILPLVKKAFPNPHVRLALVCISHLTRCGMQDTAIANFEEFDDALTEDPLLGHAYRSWFYHVSQCMQHELVAPALAQFVLKCTKYPALLNPSYFDLLGPLDVAAFYGFEHLIQLAASLQPPNSLTPVTRRSTWTLAWGRKNYACAHALLSLPGFDANLLDGLDNTTPLVSAAVEGMWESVKLLLKAPGIDVNAIGHPKPIPVLSPPARGEPVEAQLLTDLLSIAAKKEGGVTALVVASHRGNIDAVRLLLDTPGIDVNVRCQGGSALAWASRKGNVAVVKLLLEVPGVDVNAVDNWKGLTALTWAAEQGHTEIVELLLACSESVFGAPR